mmetsp:Transcript_816/g.2972  ORF Transcript_816/g.2972 Transcript_816/m.2972 type:complete len:214 (+) Transcript_816:2050-2691(+)
MWQTLLMRTEPFSLAATPPSVLARLLSKLKMPSNVMVAPAWLAWNAPPEKFTASLSKTVPRMLVATTVWPSIIAPLSKASPRVMSPKTESSVAPASEKMTQPEPQKVSMMSPWMLLTVQSAFMEQCRMPPSKKPMFWKRSPVMSVMTPVLPPAPPTTAMMPPSKPNCEDIPPSTSWMRPLPLLTNTTPPSPFSARFLLMPPATMPISALASTA